MLSISSGDSVGELLGLWLVVMVIGMLVLCSVVMGGSWVLCSV